MNEFLTKLNFLNEKQYGRRNVIIVDIQPLYKKAISYNFDMWDFTEFLNLQKRILVFYNGYESGFSNDRKGDIIEWYLENGFEEENTRNIVFYDKGYGFFRNWMDQGVSDREIIQVVRDLYMTKTWDTREIESDKIAKIQDEYGIDYEDPIYTPDIPIDLLKKFNGSYLCGGHQDECLKEIQLLMNTFNIRYKLIEKFIWSS